MVSLKTKFEGDPRSGAQPTLGWLRTLQTVLVAGYILAHDVTISGQPKANDRLAICAINTR